MSTEQETQPPVAPSAAPAAAENQASDAAATPTSTKADAPATKLSQLSDRLADIVKAADYGEMWGVQLATDGPSEHAPTTVVLQKFLRANNDNVAATEKQLTEALKWRKEMDVVNLVNNEFDEKKFGGLGYITVHPNAEGKETVITWNIYGAVKDKKATFGDINEFIRWRAAVMEIGTQKLKLNEVTEPIPEGGNDPYQMVQVHDYLSVSFLRMDPKIKAATQKTISVLSMAYPELLAHKYFVNVPAIMGWMYAAMKLILSPATLKKFHPMSNGASLVNELKSIEESLPQEYGGKGASVKDGITVSLTIKEDVIPAGTEEAPVAAVNEPRTDDVKPTEDNKNAEAPALDGAASTDEIKEVEKKLEGTKISDDAKPAEGI